MLSEFTFHHIGVVTDSIVKTSEYYKEAGYEATEKIFDPIQNVNICFLNKAANPGIELIEPISNLSPVSDTLRKVGVSPYHFCYEVGDIYKAIQCLRKKKFVMLFKPVVAEALQNRLICFLYNKEVGLIELIQS
jgi:methylmalonyl-CoA/ethylmalonyl-CoA epimerase